MGGRYIGAYFFIPLDKRPATDDEIFARLGVRDNNQFGLMLVADRNVTLLSDHVCAQLYFLANDLFVLQSGVKDDTPLEQDPALPFARAIRDGAAAVGAEVAILETHNAELQRILDRYWMVQLGSPEELAREWFGLVYLSDSWVDGWVPPPELIDRDELPEGPGRTLFGRRGEVRFY